MNPDETERLEAQLRRAARNLTYPATPALQRSAQLRLASLRAKTSGSAGNRQLAWSAAVTLLLLLLGLFTTPRARAAIAEFLQIGAVRIFQQDPAQGLPPPTAYPPPTATPAGAPGAEVPVTATPAGAAATAQPTPLDLAGLDSLFGKTTLAEARQQVEFPVRLPAYPPGLGEPDQVFLQSMEGSMLILVWSDPSQPQRAALSLHIIPPGSFIFNKVAPRVIQETQVGGRAAIWAEGPYMLILEGAQVDMRRLIDGHVLIWEQDGLTYRIETDLPLDEAIRMAESLQ